MLGSYSIKVSTSGMPQRVASAFSRIFEPLVGAKYMPIAYLGSKSVCGTNHAVLASQTLITREDVHNVVLIVLNEKPGDATGDNMEVVQIESVLSDGGKLGGLSVSPTTKIPAEAMEVFNKNFAGFLGSKVTPFALLGTQMVNGAKYVFAAETNMVVSPSVMASGNTSKICIVTVYSNYDKVEFDTIIEGTEADSIKPGTLGYAFTWMASTKEWP